MVIPSRSAARRIALARVISLTGSEAAITALLFILFKETGSSRWVAAGLLLTLGTRGVLTPIAGSLGDRFDRRRVMIASELLGGACFASLGLVGGPPALLALAFLSAVAESPFYPAASAAVPNLVLPEDLAWANGTIAVGANLGYLVGPAVGGLLLAVTSARTVFLANAASFVISAALVASVGGSFAGLRTGDDEHEHRGIRAGIRFVRRDPVLKVMVVAAAVFAVTVGATLVAQLPLATSFGRGSIGYGLIATSFGLGALLGSLAGRRITERTEMTVMPLCCLVTAAGFGAVAFAPTFAFVLAAMFVAGASDGAGDVAFELIFQRRSPDAVRSRTIAVLETVFLIGLAVSFPIAGPLVDALGPRVAYVVAGVGIGLAALLMVPLIRTSRTLRAEALGQDPRANLHVQGDASA